MSISHRDFSLTEPAYIKLTIKNEEIEKLDVLLSSLGETSSFFSKNSWAYYMAMESMCHMKVSRRVNILRTIADELVRVDSHLFGLNILAHMLKLDELMLSAMKAKNFTSSIKQLVFESNINDDISTLGSVKKDMDTQKILTVLQKITQLEKMVKLLIESFINDKKIITTTTGLAILSKDDALDFGAVGPVARASGVNNDVRLMATYGIYDEVKPEVILQEAGDTYSRLLVRCSEIKDSIRIIKEAILLLEDNTLIINKKSPVVENYVFSRVEAVRGELFCQLTTKEEGIDVNLRTPTLMNWQILKKISVSVHKDNFPLVLNSIDPCITTM